MENTAWWKDSVVYQIYPRSFADSNGDGIGDLKGITARLDYLKELGIDVIWLSPVYQSPNDDNGYDISDYKAISPEFGTMEEFDHMLEEIHKRGMYLMMDLVVNHTSDEHIWFQKSRESKDNPYRDYYIWKKGKEGKYPNNWASCFGGPAWEYDGETQMYYLHCFSKKQPDLNWENPKMRRDIYDMITWWCEKGIDGFRMDVINMISKDPDYPDDPGAEEGYGDLGPFVCNGPRVHEYLREMNREVLSKYDLITVGEASEVTAEEACSYASLDKKELDMVFQFEHMDLTLGKHGKWTEKRVRLKDLRRVLNKWQTQLEGKAWNSLYWNNHDQARAVSRFGNDSPKYREVSAKMLATCLHMMKGTPYIYQGEEIGMTNAGFSRIEDYRDIETIRIYEDYLQRGKMTKEEMIRALQAVSRDNARTPMQWDDSPNAGFTSGSPWISVNSNYPQINVKKALKDKNSVFHYYKKLIALRKEYKVIVEGRFQGLLEEDEAVYAYERNLENQRLLVACNFTEQTVSCSLFDEAENHKELISNYEGHKKGSLQPYEARVVLF